MVRVAVLLFLVFIQPCLAQESHYLHADKVDALLLSEIKKQEIVGLAAVIIDEGKVSWSKGYGYADREAKVAVDPAKTQYRWASISKPITAIAAMQLVEKGLLDLHADIRTYVPEFPDKGEKITAHQLLCHHSGIVHYANGVVVKSNVKYSTPYPFAEVVTALDLFKESPLVHSPGSKFAYTTHGYILLSAVVERAGKQRFADQVSERIAKPLGMTSFRPDYQWEEIPHRAIGYSRADGVITRRTESDASDVSWKLGGGGFTSTAFDLAAFGAGLLQEKLVSKETTQKMWTVAKPPNPDGAKPYGLGFFVMENADGSKLVGHDGSQAKTRTGLLLSPDQKRGVVLMTSSEWVDPMPIALKLMDSLK